MMSVVVNVERGGLGSVHGGPHLMLWPDEGLAYPQSLRPEARTKLEASEAATGMLGHVYIVTE